MIIPYGIFQSSMLQSSTPSGITYSTTESNDWIANGVILHQIVEVMNMETLF